MSPTNLGQLPSNLVVPTGVAQIKRGANNNTYNWNNTVGAQPLQDGAGGQMYIQVQPSRPGWWIIKAQTMWYPYTAGAVSWTYWHWNVLLSPADALGAGDDRAHLAGSDSVTFTATIDTAFRLNAGQLYTCYSWWPCAVAHGAPVGYIWYTNPLNHFIMGDFIEDGDL